MISKCNTQFQLQHTYSTVAPHLSRTSKRAMKKVNLDRKFRILKVVLTPNYSAYPSLHKRSIRLMKRIIYSVMLRNHRRKALLMKRYQYQSFHNHRIETKIWYWPPKLKVELRTFRIALIIKKYRIYPVWTDKMNSIQVHPDLYVGRLLVKTRMDMQALVNVVVILA